MRKVIGAWAPACCAAMSTVVALGATLIATSMPASYAKLLRAEYERYRKLIPQIGLKPQ